MAEERDLYRVSFRCDEETFRQLEEQAAKSHRSLNSLLTVIVEDWLAAQWAKQR
ncbi:MAG TPA: ribbon-helix-helix protein, CopG family [Acidimicrobiales bacterium]|nr:ribbon-helix-helix protein, CopG family [Acidimicrobiales bacterium]